MRTALAMAAALLLTSGCGRTPEAPAVTVEDAVVTLPAVPGRPGAAYFTLRTNRDPTRLVAIASPQAGRIELHETIEEGGVSRMVPLRDKSFAPGRPLVLAPGGGHAMLFDMDPNLRVGSPITLTFRFEPAPPVTVKAEVRGPGDAGPGGH